MVTITSKKAVISHKFLDIMSPPKIFDDDDNSKDISHTIRCWEFMLNHTDHFRGCHKLYVCSDHGQPYKSYKMLYYFSNMYRDYRMECELHFFAPRHGYSLCDSHGGCIKRLMTRMQYQLGEPIVTSEDLLDVLQRIKINKDSTFPYILEHGICTYDFTNFHEPWKSSTAEYSMSQCSNFVFIICMMVTKFNHLVL